MTPGEFASEPFRGPGSCYHVHRHARLKMHLDSLHQQGMGGEPMCKAPETHEFAVIAAHRMDNKSLSTKNRRWQGPKENLKNAAVPWRSMLCCGPGSPFKSSVDLLASGRPQNGIAGSLFSLHIPWSCGDERFAWLSETIRRYTSVFVDWSECCPGPLLRRRCLPSGPYPESHCPLDRCSMDF